MMLSTRSPRAITIWCATRLCLQIQTRAVEVSKAQVQLNRQLERAGTGTRFQVLQSETQLARDQQNLLTQEVGLRNSAIDLATNLNSQCYGQLAFGRI